jgi:serine protease AprX
VSRWAKNSETAGSPSTQTLRAVPKLRPATKRFRNACLATLALGPAIVAVNAHATTSYDPASDPYSMAAITKDAGTTPWWASGTTGAGVDVALIDTGVAPVEGLSVPGKIIYGPDLSLESQSPNLRHLDTNGHGTFMAGVIAGRDSAMVRPYQSAPASQYRGMAPDARIVSLKVGTADGGVDVTQVIAAINWVIDHKRDNGLNIRVLNLSYGTNSTQVSRIDPLSFAVERAWRSGIVVVAAAGNTGYQRGKGAPGLADPAYNPYVIGVGGYDSMGTQRLTDDIVGVYSASSRGCGQCKNPDFLAMGSHVQGLRVPNSYLDATHSEGRLGDRYFRGSGTSQAAAMVSGAVALVLQRHPTLTPDEVKRYITSTAKKVATFDVQAQGAGELNLTALGGKTPTAFEQRFTESDGSGSVEASRGLDHLTRDGVVLSGEKDIFGKPFLASTAGSTWSGGMWNGSTWSGSTWSGSTWSGSTWSGSTWSGSTWSGSTWSGSTWSGSTWSGSSWSGSSWSGSSWSGSSWSGGSWASGTWS